MSSQFDAAAWLGLVKQTDRLIEIDTALPTHALVPERFHLREAISEPFELRVDCLSVNAFLDLKTLRGEQVTLRLRLADGTQRAWHGYCVHAAQLGTDAGAARYRLTLASFLAFAQHRRDSRILPDLDVRGVVERVLGHYPQAHWRWDVTQPLRRRPITTQFRETDFDFLARLLAEEGLAWRFEHEQPGMGNRDGRCHGVHS